MKQINIKPSAIKRIDVKRTAVCMLLLAGLVGCDSIPFMDNTSDYKGAGRSRPLEVPPDLTANPTSDAYAIPGATSYSTYSQGQEGKEVGVEKVLVTPDGVRLVKEGAQSWLVVNASAEKLWPEVRQFWIDMGFAVRVENPQIGVMETEWIDSAAIEKDASGNYAEKFDKWLDKLSGYADKKKFRTRLDRGNEANTTEIYMSHRSVAGAPDDGINRVQTNIGVIETGYKADGKKTATETNAQNAELDAELLRRLMVKLGVDEQRSKSIMAEAVVIKRAEVVKESDGSATLILNDPFDRAWRRVGLALDRIGFVVEDKDRSNGVFFIRYSDVDNADTPQEEKSMLEKLKFWGNDDKQKENPERQYRVKVASGDKDNAVVTVVDKEGGRVRTTTANRIVALMYEQLK